MGRSMTAPQMVGRITDETQLPGGAVLLMKRAREAGGWFTWATTGLFDGKPRVHVKGRHPDGRRYVVLYVNGKSHSAYVRNAAGYMELTSVAEVKAYITRNPVPSEGDTEGVRRS
jgi:hypothetical protein